MWRQPDVPDLDIGLLDGEPLLWSGRPVQGLLFNPPDIFLVPFGLAFTAVPTAMITAAIGDFGSDWLPLIPITLFCSLLLAMGLFLAIGRFWVDRWLRARTTYAVTDSRVLSVRAGPFGKLVSSPLDGLPQAELSEGWGGRGAISFGHAVRNKNGRIVSQTFTLDNVPNPRPVFTLIQQAKLNQQRSNERAHAPGRT